MQKLLHETVVFVRHLTVVFRLRRLALSGQCGTQPSYFAATVLQNAVSKGDAAA